MFLDVLAASTVFHQHIPELPMGKYAHIILLRETSSFTLFQTDGELNICRVSQGRSHQDLITRLVLFKRKQSTPERLVGRELLRAYGIVEQCKYNSENFCKHCPDCITYGYAIGNKGSERSKVLVDSAFSITGYDLSHQQFTFNGPAENGTMSEQGKMRNALNEQDHVLPQVYFPAIVTLRDPTEATFIYVLNNILRTRRYGAQNTRTGAVENLVLGIVFADGELFSNLELTQAIYDQLTPEQRKMPLQRGDVCTAVEVVIPALLSEESLVYQMFTGERLQALLRQVRSITNNEQQLKAVLMQANEESMRYARTYGVDAAKSKK